VPQDDQAIAHQDHRADDAQHDIKPSVRGKHGANAGDSKQNPAGDAADDAGPDEKRIAPTIGRTRSQHGDEVRARRSDGNRPGDEQGRPASSRHR